MAVPERIDKIVKRFAEEYRGRHPHIHRSDLEAGLRVLVEIGVTAVAMADQYHEDVGGAMGILEVTKQSAFLICGILDNMDENGDVLYIGQVEEEAKARAATKDA